MSLRRLLALSVVSALSVGSMGFVVSNPVHAISPSLVAQTDPASPDAAQSPRPEGRRGGRGHHRIDFAAAATTLGVTEADLKAALGVPAQMSTEGTRPEGSRPNDTRPEGSRPRRQRWDLAAAATKLGVTEAQLIQALGITPHVEGDRTNRRSGDRMNRRSGEQRGNRSSSPSENQTPAQSTNQPAG